MPDGLAVVPSQLLVPAVGYTPLVGALVAMLDYTRRTTLAAVAGLDVAALDSQHDPAANPIGALLAHVGAVEWAYLTGTLEPGPPSPDEWAAWGPLLRLGPAAWAAARGRTVEEHAARLAVVRARTLDGLRRVDDAWLARRATLPWLREPFTHHWAWYHVMEDELNHRGQIRWLRARPTGGTGPAPERRG